MKVTKEQLRLYAITDKMWLNGRTVVDVAKASIDGGATMIQYREKDLPKEVQLEEAKALSRLCKENNVVFIVNDDVELAKASDADGVHLGLEDGSLIKAREILGDDKIIGASAHNVEEALAAQNKGVDYIGCGSVFNTTTKANIRAITPEVLKEVTAAVSIPVVAIGGINHENISELFGCNLAGVAVISAIFAKPDIKAATESLYKLTENL